MAHAQWIAIKIVSENMTLSVRNATLYDGKFHKEGNKNAEIKASEINGITIDSGKIAWIFSSGREHSDKGTKGRIDLYHRDVRVGIFDWNCPWGIMKNSFNWWPDENRDSYFTQIEGSRRSSGPIGEVTIISMRL